jgi:putative hemolysin
MSEHATIIGWTLLGAGLIGTFALNAAEISLYSVSRVRLSLRADAGERSAIALQKELARPGRTLATIMVAVNIMGYLLAEGLNPLVESPDGGPWKSVIVDVLILTPLLLIVGESLPKELARVEADRIAYWAARPLAMARRILTWVGILPLVMWFSHLGERLAGLKHHDPDASLSEPRRKLAELLKEGAAGGILSESQTTLVDRALTIRRVRVGDEMVPMAGVRTIPLDATREAALRLIGSLPHSRFPVVDTRGRVVGVLRQIDLHLNPKASPRDLLAEPARLSPEMPVTRAIAELSMSDARMGIVESAGRPIGLVTAKDLFEPLTGELPDL